MWTIAVYLEKLNHEIDNLTSEWSKIRKEMDVNSRIGLL